MSIGVTLMGGKFRSRSMGTRPYLRDALELTGVKKPRLVYIGAASGDNRAMGTALIALARLAGAGVCDWPKLGGKKKQGALCRKLLEDADAVLLGGGEVERGMSALFESGVADALRDAHHRGVVFAALLEGATLLGERWLRRAGDGASDDQAETFPCLGLVPFSLATHGDEDGWRDALSLATVRARESGKREVVYGVPRGGALVTTARGEPRARGKPAKLFQAEPKKKARALADLPPHDGDDSLFAI